MRGGASTAGQARRLLFGAVFAALLGCAGAAAAGSGPIAELQTRLASLGYDPGPIDGVMSAKTLRALDAYRRAAGSTALPETGENPVAEAQTALRRLGFLAGAADGAIGPETRDAIIRFQAANHLPIDPRISDRLLAELEQAVPSSPAAAAPPPAVPPVTAGNAPPAEAPPSPEATGRQPLPPGVTPPPIR